MRGFNIAVSGTGEVDKPRHIVVVVQKHVRLHTAFDFLELRPWKQRQTQRNGCGIQQEQLVLKTKRFLTWSQHRLAAKSFQCFPKQLLEQCRRPMLIRIAQIRFTRRLGNSKMFQFAQATTQPVTDEPQRVRVGQMTKQHCNKLRPERESSRMPFSFGRLHQSAKLCAGKMMKKLIKQTGGLYHVRALLFRPVSHPPLTDQMRFSKLSEGFFLFQVRSENLIRTRLVYDRPNKANSCLLTQFPLETITSVAL